MRARHPLAVVFSLACVVALGSVVPAGAAPRAVSAVAPTCQMFSAEGIVGAMFVNNQLVNGTWQYATAVGCSAAVADIGLYQELDHNGVKVDSKAKGFTGVSRQSDVIFSSFPCAVCGGTWHFIWGQVVKAPSGFLFTAPPAGCVLGQGGLYQACVQVKTVTL